MVKSIKTYFTESRGLLYSYFLALPLFALYEILIRISQPGQEQIVRISVDVWLQYLLSLIGFDGLTFILIALLVGGAVIIYRQPGRLKSLKRKYFIGLILESILYAILVSIIISLFLGLLFQISSGSPLQELSKLQLFALSLGAGLYEELFFRVILVSTLLYLFKRFFTSHKSASAAAIITAALAFSGVHYIGEFGDVWTLNSFLFRFLFGLFLNLIYVYRGFGCAAWTHAIYDLLVVIRL